MCPSLAHSPCGSRCACRKARINDRPGTSLLSAANRVHSSQQSSPLGRRTLMKHLLAIAIAATLLLSGCARNYSSTSRPYSSTHTTYYRSHNTRSHPHHHHDGGGREHHEHQIGRASCRERV